MHLVEVTDHEDPVEYRDRSVVDRHHLPDGALIERRVSVRRGDTSVRRTTPYGLVARGSRLRSHAKRAKSDRWRSSSALHAAPVDHENTLRHGTGGRG